MLQGITYDRIETVGLQYPVPDETHPGTPFPVAVVRGYAVPGWVGRDTLIIGSSYSGQTEETTR